MQVRKVSKFKSNHRNQQVKQCAFQTAIIYESFLNAGYWLEEYEILEASPGLLDPPLALYSAIILPYPARFYKKLDWI